MYIIYLLLYCSCHYIFNQLIHLFSFCLLASTKLQLSFGQPDFGQHPVTDLFRKLGPLTLFSAKLKWYPARDACLRKLHDQGFGFSVRGDGPIIIAGVDGGSIADVISILRIKILFNQTIASCL